MANFTFYIEKDDGTPVVGDFKCPGYAKNVAKEIGDVMGGKCHIKFDKDTGDSKVWGRGWDGVVLYAG